MIALASDYLLLRRASGESIPHCAETVSDELAGGSVESFDPEFVHHAASAVFHYFKHELGRKTVSVGEFAGALENVLRGFALVPGFTARARGRLGVLQSDLCRLAGESGEACELFFFPRLRAELRQQLRQAPRVLRFHGLRDCVKLLAGTRRWGVRCQALEGQIVAFLRECLSAEPREWEVALWVE
jgi:hypothetical protein